MKRLKLTILSTYPVWPRKHGGQLRIYNLYQNMSQYFDTTIISLNDNNTFTEYKVGDLSEISIPKSDQHRNLEWQLQKKFSGISISDIILEKLIPYTPMYRNVATKHMDNSELIVSAQPYLFHLMEMYHGKKKLIYDSQNVEYILKQQILPDIRESKNLLDKLFRLENRALKMSDIILTCSNEDSYNFQQIYNMGYDKMILTPNGVDTELVKYVGFSERQQHKKKLGLVKDTRVVFIGSLHKPNIEAVEEIIKIAHQLPDTQFIVIGNVNLLFLKKIIPKNVTFTGMIEEKEKKSIYAYADFVINPMKNGSGTNLKIAEYMACGLPIISTSVGARGYQIKEGSEIIISSLGEFPEKIKKLSVNKLLQQSLSKHGRLIVEQNYSWDKIAENSLRQIKRYL
ncbi:glycosyltransferase family 4 protein [Peribacillus frigoritolerans]|uniref:glycosyltransferase family 4 protein n=1 Tax=Peribacillus frigoritolerans TaxID=450367 RepID=UPI003871A171